MRALSALGAVVAVAAACGSGGPSREAGRTPSEPCTAPAPNVRGFRDTLADHLGDARHVAGDAIVTVGMPAAVSGKFQYGKLGKDLEGELVALYLGDTECGPWREIGQRETDDDGRAQLEIPASDSAGAKPFRFVVLGDGSVAGGRVYTVAPGTRAVLFDVDGTLTEDDAELVEDLAGGTGDMHPGADAVARYWADRGHLIVYITGRPYSLRESTAQWLSQHGFPDGPLLTTDRWRDGLPASSRVGRFKRARLEALLSAGVAFETAYGNARTDVCAYAEAGIDPARTWIIGDDAAPRCVGFPAARGFTSYAEHLDQLGQ